MGMMNSSGNSPNMHMQQFLQQNNHQQINMLNMYSQMINQNNKAPNNMYMQGINNANFMQNQSQYFNQMQQVQQQMMKSTSHQQMVSLQSGFNNMPSQGSADQIDSTNKSTQASANNNFRPVMLSDQVEGSHLTEQSQAFVPTSKGNYRQVEQHNNQFGVPFNQGMGQNMNFGNQ